MNEAILLAEALLKQLLVDAVDVTKPLTQMTIVAACKQTPLGYGFYKTDVCDEVLDTLCCTA